MRDHFPVQLCRRRRSRYYRLREDTFADVLLNIFNAADASLSTFAQNCNNLSGLHASPHYIPQLLPVRFKYSNQQPDVRTSHLPILLSNICVPMYLSTVKKLPATFLMTIVSIGESKTKSYHFFFFLVQRSPISNPRI